MKLETFYRMMSDASLPCQHCGAKLNLYETLAAGYVLKDGRFSKTCSECKGYLPQMEYRDYGVNRPFVSMIAGFTEPPRHWTESGQNKPLWAI